MRTIVVETGATVTDVSPPVYSQGGVDLYHGDALEVLRGLRSSSVHCVVTSPPYFGLRHYGEDDQIGQEATPVEYIARLVPVFRELRRVLRSDGALWVNMGDVYASRARGKGAGPRSQLRGRKVHDAREEARSLRRGRADFGGLPEKNLLGLPWRLAFALQDDGWILRQDIIWAKKNPLPESVRDRFTRAHEYLFFLTRSPRYFFDLEAIQEAATWDRAEEGATRRRRSVWSLSIQRTTGAHVAPFPPELIRPCIRATCPEGGTVLDPFMGSGTTALVARQEGRRAVGIDLSLPYLEEAIARLERPTKPRTIGQAPAIAPASDLPAPVIE